MKKLTFNELSRIFLKTVFTFIFLFHFTFTAGCDSRAGEKNREYEQALFLHLMNTKDVYAVCTENTSYAFDCAAASGLPGAQTMYLQFKAALYKVTFTPPVDEGSYCRTVLKSADFPLPSSSDNTKEEPKKYSDGTKICHLRCEGEYWKRQKENGKCSASDYPDLISSIHDDTKHKDCIKACMETGTVLF